MPVYHVGEFQNRAVFAVSSVSLIMRGRRLNQLGELTDATVLFRLRDGVTKAQLTTWIQMAKDMVGRIPGQPVVRIDHAPNSA